MSGSKWSFWLIFRIRKKLITKHLKENSSNLKEDIEEGLLSQEQKKAPKKKY